MKKEEEDFKTIITKDYKLVIPNNKQGLLVFFADKYSNNVHSIFDYNIVKFAIENGISLLFMNLKLHFYVTKKECEKIVFLLNAIIKVNKLKKDNLFIGGYSGGGNVVLRLSNYLIKTSHEIQPKGAFIIDSTVSLFNLFTKVVKTTPSQLKSKPLTMITFAISVFNNENNNLKNDYEFIKKHSPYVLKSSSIQNVFELLNTKFRVYSYPDWELNRANEQDNYTNKNIFYLKKLSESLKKGRNSGEKIQSLEKLPENDYFSWSINNEKELFKWMLE